MFGKVFIFAALLAVASSAQAKDGLRGEVFCFPAKKVPDMVSGLQNIEEKRTNIVDVDIMPRFIIKDGGVWPERFFLRTDEQEIDIPVIKPSGFTPDFLPAVMSNADAHICVQDPSRAARPRNDEGLYFEMGLSPFFHNRSGRHDMAEILEGAKDGKSFYKKMIPAVARPFMPATDHLAVKYEDGAQTPIIKAEVDGELITLSSEAFRDMHVIACKVLEKMGASALIVEGGAYNLQPVVSVKTMKRFGWGEEQDS